MRDIQSNVLRFKILSEEQDNSYIDALKESYTQELEVKTSITQDKIVELCNNTQLLFNLIKLEIYNNPENINIFIKLLY